MNEQWRHLSISAIQFLFWTEDKENNPQKMLSSQLVIVHWLLVIIDYPLLKSFKELNRYVSATKESIYFNHFSITIAIKWRYIVRLVFHAPAN